MAAVPGSLFRRVLFWAHLVCGIAAGLFILAMSATGVLLTYERQMVEHAERGNRVTAPEGATRLDADRLADAARTAVPGRGALSLVFEADPLRTVTASRGREGSALLDPYRGTVVADAAEGRRRFFRQIENWHRWLGADPRSTRANVLDVANLLFVFIVLSGIYLWVPQVMRWRNWRGLMFFQSRYVNAKVRDFNWHHVFSFWALIPLLLIAVSGVVISFDWAHRLVYAAYGEQAPQRRGPPGATPSVPRAEGAPSGEAAPRASLESLRSVAESHLERWQRLTLPVDARGDDVEITAELPSSERRPPRQAIVLRTADASVLRLSPVQGAAPQTPGQKARTWFRFVHTGEQYGVIGQTLAGLASLAACLLVYTGLALAYRRLLRPLFRRATPASPHS